MDFSTDAIDITLPADEGASLVLQIDAKVPIVDDQIDEADREYFILHLSLTSSSPSVFLDDFVSVGIIADDDGRSENFYMCRTNILKATPVREINRISFIHKYCLLYRCFGLGRYQNRELLGIILTNQLYLVKGNGSLHKSSYSWCIKDDTKVMKDKIKS